MAAIDTVFEAKLRALSASEPPKPTTDELSSSLPAGATTGASSSPRQIGGAETPTGSRRTREISMSVLEAAVPPGASIKDITGEPAGDVEGRISRRSGKEPAVEDIIVEIDKVQDYDALMDFELEWTTDPTAPKLEFPSIGDTRGFGIIHALANCCPTLVNELVNRCPIL